MCSNMIIKNYNLDKIVWEGEAKVERFMHHC